MEAGGADTVYRVLTVYDADASKATSETSNFASVLDHVVHLAEMAIDSLSGVMETIIHVGSEAEKSRISIAGLFQATGMNTGNFNTALAMSSEMLAQMRKDAAALPGTFEDLTAIFQRAIPGGAQAGKSANQIEAMASKMMAVGISFGMPADFIGREMAEMMEGRASSRVALFSKLRQFMGPDMDASKFNALGAPEKWEKISAALEKFNPMIQEYASTWDAIESTAESYLTNIIRVGSSSLFGTLKDDLAAVNAWYERNEETILAVSRRLFDDLGGAIKFVVEMVQGSVETVLDWMKAFGLANDDADAVQTLVRAMEVAGTVMGVIIGLTVAWRTAQMALNFAFLANPIGLVVVAVTALAAGVLMLISYWDDLMDSMTQAIDSPIMRSLMRKAGFIPEGATDEDINDAMGGARRDKERRQAELKKEFGDDGVMAHIKGMLEQHGLYAGTPAVSGAHEFMPGAQGFLTPDQKAQQDAKSLLDKAGKPVTQHVTNIGAINMYNNIYDAEDPARVITRLAAKAVRDQISHPNQSPSAGVFE
jgi:hypothetical protein